jgi:hypothetical protein
MRSILLVGLLIVALIGGILVVQHLQTETSEKTRKTETIDRARQARDKAEGAAKETAEQITEAAEGLSE